MSFGNVARRLPPLPSTSDVLRLYSLRARKSLSQNFLLQPRLLDKIARTAGPLAGKTVVEVGPGPGGITRAILGNGAREVHVIEKDKRFLPALQLLQEASGGILHINMGDVLHFNMSRMFPDELRVPWDDPSPPDLALIGNLPFNVATPLIVRLLHAMHDRSNLFSYGRVPLTLTFQQEVAERMVAPPNSPARCRLSVFCQNYTHVRLRQTIGSGAFVPRPQVDVGLVTLLPLRKPYIEVPFHLLEKVVTAMFRGKRKAIHNSLRKLYPVRLMQSYQTDKLLNLASLDPGRTALSLTMEEIERLCYAFQHQCDEHPQLESYVHRDLKELLLTHQMKHGLLEQGSKELGDDRAKDDDEAEDM